MKISPYPKFPSFIYRFLLLEFICELFLSLLPTGLRLEFPTREILFLSLVVIKIWSFALWGFSKFFRELKVRGILFLIPFLLLFARIFCNSMIVEFAQTRKFYAARSMYEEVVYLTENNLLKNIYDNIELPKKFWYIGKNIQYKTNNSQKVIYFKEFSVFAFLNDTSCGFLHASSFIDWDHLKEMGVADVFDFQKISEKWYYGCKTLGW
jgi:hypothetical protein